MDAERKQATRRWYKARHHELRELMWDWDPLGLMGAPEDEYDCLIDPVLTALAGGARREALEVTLRHELVHMGEAGYSLAAAERGSAPYAVSGVVQRIEAWWQGVPPPR